VQRASRLADTIWKDPSLRLGSILLVVLIGWAAYGSIAMVNPLQQDLSAAFRPPGAAGYPLGSDSLGRDLGSWIAHGILTSLVVALGVVGLSSAFGTSVGLIAGYVRGMDSVVMRLADLQLAVPPLILFLAAAAVMSFNIPRLILLLAVVGWIPYARVCRAVALVERSKGYVEAAKLSHCSTARIMIVHLLPQTVSQIAVLASLQCGFALLWEAGLSFLGLGLQPPVISLGFQISAGANYLGIAWWITSLPGLALAVLILAFNSLGDGLNRVFNADIELMGR
jgi:peptide/nickel transport system permease protein